jgi:hypothetical protein
MLLLYYNSTCKFTYQLFPNTRVQLVSSFKMGPKLHGITQLLFMEQNIAIGTVGPRRSSSSYRLLENTLAERCHWAGNPHGPGTLPGE